MKIIIRHASDDLGRHAKRLVQQAFEKSKLPRIGCADRAVVPTWCDICGERAWGYEQGFTVCPDCRKADKKLPIGFIGGTKS